MTRIRSLTIALALIFTTFSQAEEPALDSLTLIPADCTGFVTVRISELARKFGDLSTYEKRLETIGLKLADVDRLTIALRKSDNRDEHLFFIAGTQALPAKKIRETICPDGKTEKLPSATITTSASESDAVYFPSDKMLVFGSRAAVLDVVNRDMLLAPSAATIALRTEAARHDIAGQGVTSLIGGSSVVDVAGLASASATVDFGTKVQIALTLRCTDATNAAKLTKSFRGLVDVCRAQLLMIGGIVDANHLIREIPDNLDKVPRELVRRIEKGLSTATVKQVQSEVRLAATLPIDPTLIRSEVTKYLKESGSEAEGLLYPFGMFDDRYESNPAVIVKVLTVPSAQVVTQRPDAIPPTTMPVPPYTSPPAGRIELIGATGGMPTLPAMPAPSCAAMVAATSRVCIAVANTCKEPARLYELSEDGKMTFNQNLPAGETRDLLSGKRWVVVFLESTRTETLDPRSASDVWLLRPPVLQPAPLQAPIPMTVPVTSYKPR